MAGPCQTEVDAFCLEVKPGEGRLAKCLSQQLAEEDKPKYDGTRTSDACKKELDKFHIDRAGMPPHPPATPKSSVSQ